MDTLYALDTKGRIKQWRVWTEGNIIVVEHGLMEGKKQLTKIEAKPKNIGKANATTAIEQAMLEAKAKHTKQLDKGYSPDKPDGKPALSVMLAKDYRKSFNLCNKADKDDLVIIKAQVSVDPLSSKVSWVGVPSGSRYRDIMRLCNQGVLYWFGDSLYTRNKSISYPCFVQPKLDGVRSLIYAEGVNGHIDSIKYRSRGNKGYSNIEDIDKELKIIFKEFPELVLDGELYCHGMPLQDISSSVKKHNENTRHIMFHIFDVAVPDKSWLEREHTVRQIGQIIKDRGLKRIKAVEAHVVASEDEMLEKHSQYIQEGYEGIMLRNYEGLYMFGQRSKDLQKYKTFMDDEFKIVGMELDKYKHGVAILTTSQGKTFKAKLAGTDKQRTEMWLLRDQYIGQYATIKYQSLTNDGIPQFPVLISTREMGAGGPMY